MGRYRRIEMEEKLDEMIVLLKNIDKNLQILVDGKKYLGNRWGDIGG